MQKDKNNNNKLTLTKSQPHKKRSYVSQKNFPRLPLTEATRLAKALHDDFAGKPTAPYQLAMAVDISPTSSNWQDICGASIAYGLTSGGYNASNISLTELGKRVVAPTIENDDKTAAVQAALTPRIPKEFFEHYNRSKFPQEKIAINVLAEMGVPLERVDSALEIIKENGQYVGLIVDTKTGLYVALDTPSTQQNVEAEIQTPTPENGDKPGLETPREDGKQTHIETSSTVKTQNNRVFIGHGKETELLSQIKKILSFGKLEPVVAEEHETTALPIPEKVLKEMRSCFAGILHLSPEKELIDTDGNMHHKINENVLIEIGAAMALYDKNFILLVEKGINLPSNLQGLYRCEYEGDKLDVDATMKLLAAFSEFKHDG